MCDEAFVVAIVLMGLATFAIGLVARRREVPGRTAANPQQLLRAYLFFFTLGGFGVLTAAFVAMTYPNPDLLGHGVAGGLSGLLTIWSLLGIRRARRQTQD